MALREGHTTPAIRATTPAFLFSLFAYRLLSVCTQTFLREKEKDFPHREAAFPSRLTQLLYHTPRFISRHNKWQQRKRKETKSPSPASSRKREAISVPA
jgi:hypothetical protein